MKNGADCLMIALGFIMLATIQNIRLGLKLMYKEITEEQERFRQTLFTTVAMILIIVYIGFTAVVFVNENFGAGTIAYLECSTTLLLNVLLIIATCAFERKLKQSSIHDVLIAEKRTIRLQAIAFCFGFSIRSMYSM